SGCRGWGTRPPGGSTAWASRSHRPYASGWSCSAEPWVGAALSRRCPMPSWRRPPGRPRWRAGKPATRPIWFWPRTRSAASSAIWKRCRWNRGSRGLFAFELERHVEADRDGVALRGEGAVPPGPHGRADGLVEPGRSAHDAHVGDVAVGGHADAGLRGALLDRFAQHGRQVGLDAAN